MPQKNEFSEQTVHLPIFRTHLYLEPPDEFIQLTCMPLEMLGSCGKGIEGGGLLFDGRRSIRCILRNLVRRLGNLLRCRCSDLCTGAYRFNGGEECRTVDGLCL